MWEAISAISGAVSAICDVRGLRGGAPPNAEAHSASLPGLASPPKEPRSLVTLSIGWVLLVSSYMWIAQPYGAFITDREWKEILGWLLAGPALLVILTALGVVRRRDG